jgi:hypothetical protein
MTNQQWDPGQVAVKTALTAPTAGTYLLIHGPDSAELWLVGDEDGPVEPELTDVAVAAEFGQPDADMFNARAS